MTSQNARTKIWKREEQNARTKIWKREEVESPCVQVCVIHPETKLCLGCSRTGDEIARWSRLTPHERRAVMADLPARDPKPKGRRGGRSRRTT